MPFISFVFLNSLKILVVIWAKKMWGLLSVKYLNSLWLGLNKGVCYTASRHDIQLVQKMFPFHLLQMTWSKCTSLSPQSNGASPLRTTWRPCLHTTLGFVDLPSLSRPFTTVAVIIWITYQKCQKFALSLLLCYFHSHSGRLWELWEHQTCWQTTWNMAWVTAWSPTSRSSASRFVCVPLCLHTCGHIVLKEQRVLNSNPTVARQISVRLTWTWPGGKPNILKTAYFSS